MSAKHICPLENTTDKHRLIWPLAVAILLAPKDGVRGENVDSKRPRTEFARMGAKHLHRVCPLANHL